MIIQNQNIPQDVANLFITRVIEVDGNMLYRLCLVCKSWQKITYDLHANYLPEKIQDLWSELTIFYNDSATPINEKLGAEDRLPLDLLTSCYDLLAELKQTRYPERHVSRCPFRRAPAELREIDSKIATVCSKLSLKKKTVRFLLCSSSSDLRLFALVKYVDQTVRDFAFFAPYHLTASLRLLTYSPLG